MLLAYGVGRRRGRKQGRAGAPAMPDFRDPECVNYELFCRNYGSCDGQVCEKPGPY